jgi:hypothetical protein
MERESVGGTLRTLHRSLRPSGVLLDIHPEPEHARVQVRIGREMHEVGNVDDTAYIRDIHAGREVIASLIRERLFVRDHEAVFEHVLHVSDVETWLAFREERSSRSVLDPRVVNKVRELLSEAAGEILVVNRGYACRLVMSLPKTKTLT